MKHFIIIVLVSILCSEAAAQDWVSTGGPGDGLDTVTEMIAPADGSILACTTSNLWYTDSSQSNWKSSYLGERPKFVIDSIHYYILKVLSYSVRTSTNMGKTWSGPGITGYSLGNITAALVTPNNFVFAGTDMQGLYRNPDARNNWFACTSIT